MSEVLENALRMLGVLIEESSGDINRGELRTIMKLPKEGFDQAQQFLLQGGYIGGTAGGDSGSCWVKSLGIEYYEQQMKQRLPISQLAKRIARLIAREARVEGASVTSEDICSELEIDRESYLEAMQELADFDLVEETLRADQESFAWVNLTPKGRRAVRSGFAREMPGVTQQIGAVIEGPVSDSTIQAVAQTYQSVVQQSVERENVEGLIEVLSSMTDKMVEAVKADLTTEQLAAYAAAARDFKEQASKEEPNPSVVQRLVTTLAFFDNLNGTLDLGERSLRLALQVAPYMALLLQAVNRLLDAVS
jgi:hypothetical protein